MSVIISREITAAFESLGVEGAKLSKSNRLDLADYMSDSAFGAAKTLRMPPAKIAQMVVDQLSQDGYTASAIGGFVNIRLTDEAIIDGLGSTHARATTGQSFLIDSGGPNTAKPMHVGHLRSLVIGDSLARILRHLGHRVIKDIHYGDWGFQMGLLLAALPTIPTNIDELETAYPLAAARAKDDPEFKAAAHRAVVALQNGDPDATARWMELCSVSEESVDRDLTTLGVSFDLWQGESDANDYIAETENLLQHRLIESQGAKIVETEHGALMFQNSQGGYLYGATDLATIVDRAANYWPQTILYVVDERQSLHFKQVFDAASGLTTAHLEHVPFGTVNGPDGKPFRTRAGGVPRLSDLMSEAITKATEKQSKGSPRAVAMAALKFGDLINRRTSSYSFDLDRALRFEGRTGPYMLYQIVRIKSITQQADVSSMMGRIAFNDPDERALAMHMLDFWPVIEKAGETRMPHFVAEYAYDLAQLFSRFYTGPSIKDSVSRFTLAKHVETMMEILMALLGIESVSEM